MPGEYWNHGGRHRVSIVYCPAIRRDRWLHLSQDGENSWVLRDYVARLFVRRRDEPGWPVTVSLGQVEALVEEFEQPPFHAWENIRDWDTYLRMRSIVQFGPAFNTDAGQDALRNSLLRPEWWQPLE
jgi:hypothetical protein